MSLRKALAEFAAGNVPAYLLREIGLRGAVKSVYYSSRYAGSPVVFVFGKTASVAIASSATIDARGPFIFDAKNTPHVAQRAGGSRLTIADGATFRVTADGHAQVGSGTVMWIGGTFEMGDSFINGDGRISCADRISIGDGCVIAWNVELLDNTGGHTLVVDGEPRPVSAPIEIEDSVWIGHDVTVQQGVTIGEGAVVASNSLVTKDVPPATLAAGIPATVIEEDIRWRP